VTEQTTVQAILTGTVPSGTANGVLYLNGSKVVSSGSGLTFDGAKFQVSGSDIRIVQASNSANNGLYFRNFADTNTFAKVAYDAATGNLQVGTTQNYDTIFLQNGSEQMRLTSTGLGIGTNNPQAKLDVYANGGMVRLSGDSGNNLIQTSTSSGATGIGLWAGGSARLYSTGGMTFSVNSTLGTGSPSGYSDAMTLDSSGNLGLGATPSAWGSDYKALQIGGFAGAFLSYKNFVAALAINSYSTNANDVALVTGNAAKYELNGSGEHVWKTATVTAGNAISFTQAMTLDASGNLLVGTTSTTIPTASGSLIYLNSPGALYVGHANGAASGTIYSAFAYNGSVIGSITQDGTSGVLYNLTSDRRLKDNIVSSPSASAEIDAMQVVSYNWKSAPDEHVKYGLIAQDLHAVAPQAVSVGDGGEEVEKTWGVDYSKLVPMLIKEIQSLRARVAAIEA
jgi:hypothetical protein